MAKESILSDNSNILRKLSGDSNANFVVVSIGGQTRRMYMIDIAGGPQILRTQLDIAVDGTPYYLIAGKGSGTFQCTFLEGPFQVCGGARIQDYSIMSSIDIMSDSLKNRRIKITTDASSPIIGNSSTQYKAIFNGVINTVTQTTQGYENGSVIVVSRIEAIGQWGNR